MTSSTDEIPWELERIERAPGPGWALVSVIRARDPRGPVGPLCTLVRYPGSELVLVGYRSGLLGRVDPASGLVELRFPRTHGFVAPTRDGALVLALGERGALRAMERDGTPRWSRTLDPAAWGLAPWRIEGGSIEHHDDGGHAFVELSHPRPEREWDDPPWDPRKYVEVVFDVADGAVRSVDERPRARLPRRARPGYGAGSVWNVQGAAVPIGASSVACALLFDPATLLVGTREGELRRFEKAAIPKLGCALCDGFLARSAATNPYLGSLSGLGPALVVPDGFPEGHYPFELRREGNECPSCRRRIVVIEEHRSTRSSTYVELGART